MKAFVRRRGVVLIKTTAESAPTLLLNSRWGELEGAGQGREDPGLGRGSHLPPGTRCSRASPGSSFASQLPRGRAARSSEGWKGSVAGMSLAELVSLKLALPAVLRLAGTC